MTVVEIVHSSAPGDPEIGKVNPQEEGGLTSVGTIFDPLATPTYLPPDLDGPADDGLLQPSDDDNPQSAPEY